MLYPTRIERILNLLYLSSNCINSLGLLDGKMGISLLFYSYARFSRDEFYKNFAEKLLDEIFEGVDINTPLNIESGLTGIGWGIEYLVSNNFIEGDTDDILQEIDYELSKLAKSIPIHISNDDNFYNFGLYFLSRIQLDERRNNKTYNFKLHIIHYLLTNIDSILTKDKIDDTKINNLKPNQINSLIYFIIGLRQLDLFIEETERLCDKLYIYCKTRLDIEYDFVNYQTFIQLIELLLETLKIASLKQKYSELISAHNQFYLGKFNYNNEKLIDQYIKVSYYSMIYPVDFYRNVYFHDIEKRAINIINSEDYWDLTLNTINVNNLSINGLAGIGMALLSNKKLERLHS